MLPAVVVGMTMESSSRSSTAPPVLVTSNVEVNAADTISAAANQMLLTTDALHLGASSVVNTSAQDIIVSAAEAVDVLTGSDVVLTAGKDIALTAFGKLNVSSVDVAELTARGLSVSTTHEVDVAANAFTLDTLATVDVYAVRASTFSVRRICLPRLPCVDQVTRG